MTKGKATKGGTKASQSKDHSGSKRWKKCKCGNWMHVGSAQCWKCRGLGDPKNIMGSANPYAAFLLRQENEKATQIKAITKGVKGTKARAKVATVTAKTRSALLPNGDVLTKA